MANLHNAICDHALPYRLKSKRMKANAITLTKVVPASLASPQDVYPAKTYTYSVTGDKTNDELLTDSKKMVTKLKENIAKEISTLASEDVASVTKPRDVPGAPKSPRLHLPIILPEPDKALSDIAFKVPSSPRTKSPSVLKP